MHRMICFVFFLSILFLAFTSYSYAITWEGNYDGSGTGSYNDWCCKSGYPCEVYSHNNGTIEYRIFSNSSCSMGKWGYVYVYYTPTESITADIIVNFSNLDCSYTSSPSNGWVNISQKIIVYNPNGTVLKRKVTPYYVGPPIAYGQCKLFPEELNSVPLEADLTYKIEVYVLGESGNGGEIHGGGTPPYWSLAPFFVDSISVSEMHPDSCNDTDDGSKPLVNGTISGYIRNEPYSYTDFCYDTTYLREYFCSGYYEGWGRYNCKNYGSGCSCFRGRCGVIGDITGPSGEPDGKVDIMDISIIAAAYGSYSGYPKWNPDADLNSDGRVDIRDVALAAKNYGKCCPPCGELALSGPIFVAVIVIAIIVVIFIVFKFLVK